MSNEYQYLRLCTKEEDFPVKVIVLQTEYAWMLVGRAIAAWTPIDQMIQNAITHLEMSTERNEYHIHGNDKYEIQEVPESLEKRLQYFKKKCQELNTDQNNLNVL